MTDWYSMRLAMRGPKLLLPYIQRQITDASIVTLIHPQLTGWLHIVQTLSALNHESNKSQIKRVYIFCVKAEVQAYYLETSSLSTDCIQPSYHCTRISV